jgi:sigma-B regulation protein RsbQ
MNAGRMPHLDRRGAGDPTLLFVHGWGLDRTAWDPLRAHLNGFETVAYDTCGFGGNTQCRVVEGETLTHSAAELMRVRDGLSREHVIVIGSSRGGTIALRAAAERPDAFAAVIVIGAPPRVTAGDDYSHGARREDLEAVAQQLESAYGGTFEAIAPVFYLTDDAAEADVTGARGLLLASNARTSDPKTAVAVLRDNLSDDIRGLLPRIAVPVLVIGGQRDPVVPPDAAKFVASSIPYARLEILPGAGHVPHLTMPEKTSRLIRHFIGTLPQPRTNSGGFHGAAGRGAHESDHDEVPR